MSDFAHIPPSTIVIGPRQRSAEPELADNDSLLSSIRQFGIIEPIVIDRKHNLIAGFRRLARAVKLDMATVPVRYLDSLDDLERAEIEAEENLKREDLPWRDFARAVGNLHLARVERDPAWTQEKTATRLSFDEAALSRTLTIFRNLDNPDISEATSFIHAYNILQRQAERQSATIVEQLLRGSTLPLTTLTTDGVQTDVAPPPLSTSSLLSQIRTDPDPSSTPSGASGGITPATVPPAVVLPLPILCTDFTEWVARYSGPKFNLIHCDFPYGVNAADAMVEEYENTRELFWRLTTTLTDNIEKLLSYSAHVVFWLAMRNYDEAKQRLRSAGLHVIDRPLIWYKTDQRGSAGGLLGTQPKHIYEAALLCYRGNRPLVSQRGDLAAAPTVSNPIHPTQKPDEVIEHFLSMLIDSHTDMLDPTAGSGSAIRVAEKLGARLAFGIERDSAYANAANASILRARRRQVEVEL